LQPLAAAASKPESPCFPERPMCAKKTILSGVAAKVKDSPLFLLRRERSSASVPRSTRVLFLTPFHVRESNALLTRCFLFLPLQDPICSRRRRTTSLTLRAPGLVFFFFPVRLGIFFFISCPVFFLCLFFFLFFFFVFYVFFFYVFLFLYFFCSLYFTVFVLFLLSSFFFVCLLIIFIVIF